VLFSEKWEASEEKGAAVCLQMAVLLGF